VGSRVSLQVVAFNVHTQQVRRKFHSIPSAVFSVAMSADGQTLVTAHGERTARVYSASSLAPLAQLSGHMDVVRCVAMRADGRVAVTGSWDGLAKVWDVRTATELHTLAGHSGDVLVGACDWPRLRCGG
jgi:WD40 repeat protein